jgi:hypothetical protein
MSVAIERLTTAKQSVGFAVDCLATACQVAPETERLRQVLKQAAELFDSISRLEEAFKNSANTTTAAPQ